MKIACPSCSTGYNIPEEKVPRKGVKIRCKICDFEMLLVRKPDVRSSASAPVAMVIVCPHCSHKQMASPECGKCGVLFKKLFEAEKPVETALSPHSIPESRSEPIKSRWKIIAVTVLTGVALFIAVCVYAFLSWVKSFESYKVSENYIKQNKDIRSVVGADIRFGTFPLFSVEVTGDQGNATYNIKVKGSKDTRRVTVYLSLVQGSWRVYRVAYADEHGNRKTVYPDRALIAEATGEQDQDQTDAQAYESQKHVVLSYDHLQNNNLSEALAESQKAIDIDPENAEAYYWRGRIYLLLKRPDDALDDFSTCSDLDPDYVDAYNQLCLLFSQRGNYEESLYYISRSIELAPDNGWAYYTRGATLYRMGKIEAALTDVEYACDLGYEDGCKIYENLKNRVR
ncbi:tetratricopeptide repeat protein [Thermodesulfobacteriota bacterium]